MATQDDALEQTLGAEAAAQFKAMEEAALQRLVAKGLGRVQPIGKFPDPLPGPVLQDAVPVGDDVPATPDAKPNGVPERVPERTAREHAAEKRMRFPDHVDAGPPRGSLLRVRF